MKGIALFSTLFFLLGLPAAGSLGRAVLASEFDIYVDEGADQGGDGSRDKPFREIEDAVEKAKSGEVVYVANGSYGGGFEVGNGIKVHGQSSSKVKVRGPLVLADGAILSNLTVSGGRVAVTVESEAHGEVDGCTVTDFEKIGINIRAGNGKLTVENSTISKSDGKGLYVEKGNELKLSSSKVYGNAEEGVDIREKVDGSIVGNEIYGNGESGIEVVLGSADLSIRDNQIEGNGSSGIATQYYSSASKLGVVKIKGNNIRDSRKFGIDCNVPQAGGPSSGYWSKSLDVEGNDFQGNKMGRINARCKLVEADTGDGGEEYDEHDTGEGEAVQPNDEMEQKRIQEEAMIAEEFRIQTEQLRQELGQLQTSLDENQQDRAKLLERLGERSRFLLWVKGPAKEDLAELQRAAEGLGSEIVQLEALADRSGEEQLRDEIESKRKLLSQDKKFLENRLIDEHERFSMWGWFLTMSSWDRIMGG